MCEDLCLYNPNGSTLPGPQLPQTFSSCGIRTFMSYQAKLFHFPFKTVCCCSSVPIPHTIQILEVKEYSFCKRRKYLDKNKRKSPSFYCGPLDLIRFIFVQQTHADIPLYFSPLDVGLENWFSFLKAWGSCGKRRK